MFFETLDFRHPFVYNEINYFYHKEVHQMNTNYQHFGVMLDMSRNAVMKVGEVKKMIDCLQIMGYNTLELYTEDTYEIAGEPHFGYLRGRYTGAEIKEIDAYAKAHGIELIPCVQTLAHFTALSRYNEYSEIFDLQDILLIDEPKTYAFIDKIFATIAENFTSRLVNIGMDEAHMVGLGKYLKKHGYQDRYEMLIRHLSKVAEIAKKYGFKAHMWSDMFFRLGSGGNYYAPELEIPESVKQCLPENVELTYWDYYHNEKSIYDGMIKRHQEFGKDVWFAGGAWCWYGFAPLAKFSFQTMKPAMESVREHDVKNVIITMWGDNGKECSFFSLLHALYAIRQYADGNFDEAKISQGFYDLFQIKYEDMMLLDLPNYRDFNAELKGAENPCKSLLYTDPFLGWLDNAVAKNRPIPYAQYAERLKKAKKSAGELAYIFEQLEKLCSVLAIKATLGVKTRKAYQSGDRKALAPIIKEYSELKKRLITFHEVHYALWHKENKPQGWEIQDARIGGLIQRVETCKKRLKLYVAGKLDKIEELEEEILPYGDGDTMIFAWYDKLVSTSIL